MSQITPKPSAPLEPAGVASKSSANRSEKRSTSVLGDPSPIKSSKFFGSSKIQLPKGAIHSPELDSIKEQLELVAENESVSPKSELDPIDSSENAKTILLSQLEALIKANMNVLYSQDGASVLHIAYTYGDKLLVETILTYYQDNGINPIFMKPLHTEDTNLGFFLRTNNAKSFSSIVKYLGDLNSCECQNLFKEVNSKNENFFHYLVRLSPNLRVEIIKKVDLEKLKEVGKELLSAKDARGESPIDIAVIANFDVFYTSDYVKEIARQECLLSLSKFAKSEKSLEFFKTMLETTELLSDLMLQLLKNSVEYLNPKHFEILLNYLPAEVKTSLVPQALYSGLLLFAHRTKNYSAENAIEKDVERISEMKAQLDDILKNCDGYLNKDFKSPDKNKNSFLYVLAVSKECNEISKKLLSTMSVKDVLENQDGLGCNILHRAILKRNFELVKLILELAKTSNDSEQLLAATTIKNQTALDLAITIGNVEITDYLSFKGGVLATPTESHMKDFSRRKA